jgi:serine/threonine protein kinase
MQTLDRNMAPDHAGKASRVDQGLDEKLSAGADTIELAEGLDYETTSELPHPGTALDVVPAKPASAAAAWPSESDPGSGTASGGSLRERYIIEQRLGNGGTGEIFRALDLQHDCATGAGPHVAIKLLRPELRGRAQSIARLRREFRQTQALSHPNVVRFRELGCDQGTWFIAMELLTGEALGQRLRQAHPIGLPTCEALWIAAECGGALAFAHDNGVTHGDIKPDNVFVTATNEVRVLDFGTAPDTPHSPPDTETFCQIVPAATRAYASPEVLAGQRPEPRDDVFSLACMIYEMLGGRHPYGRRGSDEARDARLEIEPLPALSVEQWRALAAGLAWHREQRPAGVRELLRALAVDETTLRAQEAVPHSMRIARFEPRQRSSGARRRAIAVAAIAVLGLMTGQAGFEPRSLPKSVAPGSSTIAGVTRDNALTDKVDAAAVADHATLISPQIVARARPLTQSGPVSFESASMVVSRHTVMAAIPVRRLDSGGRSARINWRAIDGSAVAGRDYSGPKSGVARFVEGHTFGMIYVPIVNDSQAAGDKSFTVELTRASPGASLGSTRRIIVTIQGGG